MKNTKHKTLVSIEVITKLKPIKGKDFIEHAILGSTKVIVTKDLFKEGDKCVLIRKGAKLPMWAESITSYPCGRHLLKNDYCVKQIKIGDAVSDGLALHLSLINAIEPDILVNAIPVGMDIRHILNVMSLKDYHAKYAEIKMLKSKMLKSKMLKSKMLESKMLESKMLESKMLESKMLSTNSNQTTEQ